MNPLLAERKAHLAHKLCAVNRLASHLAYSRARLAYPIPSIDTLDEAALESVSALLERFGKLQDMLGATFREIVHLSGESADDMNDVLSRLEKIGVLSSGDQWRALRALRKLVAHEYDADDAGKTALINEIALQSGVLIGTASKVSDYAREKLEIA